MDCIGIIPARFGSTRFPGKPLALIAGKPMIGHVIERARQAIDRIVVATDDNRIADVATFYGAEAIMTSPDIPNGTARCIAAARTLTDCPEIVVNIQGDEPMIDHHDIAKTIDRLSSSDIGIATLARYFDTERPLKELSSPNRVKVTIDNNQNALYFSRQVIPYTPAPEKLISEGLLHYLIHCGIYAFRLHTLMKIAELPPSPLAIAENLEQLTWLQNGYRIGVALTYNNSTGVDTPADIDIITRQTQK